MKKIILLVGVVTFIIGCSKSSDPGVTEKIDLGWEKAVDYYCKTVKVSSPLGF